MGQLLQVIKQFLQETGDPSLINFKLHDFGFRGVSSFESAAIGGAAHLINFMGSDTIAGVLALMEYYNAKEMPGFSIPAAEHSSITTWGKEHEADAYRNMLKQFGKPGALLAVVSDSYDIYNACKIWGTELKDEVIVSEAIVVIRPDSGYPAAVVLKCVEILDQYFGSTINTKGYKVLNNVRVLQGDGINEQSIREILGELKSQGFSADNVAFGCGGILLQQVNRDTLRFAMKCSAAKINGNWIDVFKDPITDLGKRSKKGRLELIRNANGEIMTISADQSFGHERLLEVVWKNGKLVKDYTLEEIRKNTNKE
jgi:nicotinamide phosphoribosyltransferase